MLQFVAASLNPSGNKANFQVGVLEDLPYEDEYFDLTICSAVLHFAQNEEHFNKMMREISRVTKRGGDIFIRTASSIGIEDKILPTGDGRYDLPDGSSRYLIHKKEAEDVPVRFGLEYVEPFKTVNVNDERCMSTLILRKL